MKTTIYHSGAGMTFLTVLLVLFAGIVGAQTGEKPEGVSFEGTRETIQKWVEAEQLVSKEKTEWKLGRQVLQDRIDLLANEIKDLEGKIAEARKNVEEADKQREEMTKDNENLKSASEAMGQLIGQLEGRMKTELLPRLPEPLIDRIKPLTQRIPENVAETKLSQSARFQNVVGILNEINKFNKELPVLTSIRNLEGKETEVKLIYLGLGQAYYVDNGGLQAGVGRPGAAGWEWTPMNDRAPEIAKVFKILDSEELAQFVPLPVKIQ